MAIKLVVEDADGATVVNDDYDGAATGDLIFRAMNLKCPFGLWASAEALGPHVKGPVMNSLFPRMNETFAKQSLQQIIDSLGRAEVPCEFTFQVRKKQELRDPAADSPSGPAPSTNPGLRPGHGPDYGGFETPGGPKSLARMRGMLTGV